MTTGIYKITNLVNSKVYIGASRRIEARWWEHRNGYTSIADDLKIFGLENFKFEVLLECPENMLTQWERDMICLYDADSPEGGYNSPMDRPYNLETSKTLKGRKLSSETRRKLSEVKKGHTVSDETKRKISETLKGHTTSEETKHKMSEALKGKPAWNKGLKMKDLNELKIHSNNGLKIHSNNEK